MSFDGKRDKKKEKRELFSFLSVYYDIWMSREETERLLAST